MSKGMLMIYIGIAGVAITLFLAFISILGDKKRRIQALKNISNEKSKDNNKVNKIDCDNKISMKTEVSRQNVETEVSRESKGTEIIESNKSKTELL